MKLIAQQQLAFWSKQVEEWLGFKKWDTEPGWNPPFAKWFVGGKLNISYNCLDRHLTTSRKNKAAIIWEGETGEIKTITYLQLHQEVSRFANVLKSLGVKTGDRVALYMPLIPALSVPMLAGVPRCIFGTFEGYKKALEIANSSHVGVCFCVGTWLEGGDLMGADVVSAITVGRKGAVAVLDGDERLAGIVTDGDGRRAFSRDLIDSRLRPRSRLLAWVLMPDHWHGLIVLGRGEDLAYRIGVMKANTARCVRMASPTVGRVWARSFHDHALRNDEQELLNHARYVVLNPVRAGLVRRIGDYPYWDAVWLG